MIKSGTVSERILVCVALVVAFLTASSTLLNVSAASSPNISSSSSLLPDHPLAVTTEKNPHWSGYADVSATNGSVTGVRASFILPSVTCNSSSPQEQELYFFAALDDLVTSSDFEYAGALAYCPQGYTIPEYFAVETVNFTISTWAPNPGDTIFASITVSKGNFVYNVTDVTSGHSTRVKSNDSGATLNSAEIVTDTGNCGTSSVTLDCPLPDFGTLSFGSGHTSVARTCYATIDGKSKAIGNFGSAATLYKGVTTNDAGTIVDAATSGLSTAKSSFTVTFKHAGP